MATLDKSIVFQVHLVIFQIVLPILVLFGTIGNTITLYVLLKPKHRTSSIARMLTVLTVTDLFVLWGVGLDNWILIVFDIDVINSSVTVCKLYTFFTMFLCQLSAFCIAAITLNRFIAVLLPFKARTISTLRNTNILLVCLVILSVLATCHILFAFRLTVQGQCDRVKELYSTLLMTIWVNAHLFFFLVTVAFVIIANICIIGRLVYRMKYVWKQFNHGKRSTMKATSNTTRTLVLVNFVYVLCYMPSAAFFIKYRRRPIELRGKQGMDYDEAVMLLFRTVSIIAFSFNSSINFLLYFFSASKFRKEVKICLK